MAERKSITFKTMQLYCRMRKREVLWRKNDSGRGWKNCRIGYACKFLGDYPYSIEDTCKVSRCVRWNNMG